MGDAASTRVSGAMHDQRLAQVESNYRAQLAQLSGRIKELTDQLIASEQLSKDWHNTANDRSKRIVELMEANERLRLENESLRQQVRGLKDG